MAWVKSPLSFPNIVSIVYSGEVSGINSKRSIPVTKKIHRQNGPQPKIKKCNIFGCPYNFFYNHESKSLRYRQQKNLSKCNMLNYRCETFIGIKSTNVYRF